MNDRPTPDPKVEIDSLIDALPLGERIPRRAGELAFDRAWEIRSFSMTVALHVELGFEWTDFQKELIAAVRHWESEHTDLDGWSYHERWLVAFERLAETSGWIESADLDARTEQILAQPPGADHQHAVREPVTVQPPRR
ncbi:nitrile hydratase accessory protein [Pseudonocardia sp. NPDC046786]|uniref:nitrile hydratase accessory protein n=1 Tax=Pseudonocardia sp. NPDC046786 TaxID=3155471 RepID=UPI0033C3A1AA